MSNSEYPKGIFNEDLESISGKNALKRNINAVRAVSDSITTTLGPHGLNKVIIDSLGDMIVTSDGAKVLEEMSIDNPTGKMIVDLAKTLHKKVGDGAVSSVLFIGSLMERVEDLISMDLPPRTIYYGFSQALSKTKEILDDIAIPIDLEMEDEFKKIIRTLYSTKNLSNAKEEFVTMTLKAFKAVKEKRGKEKFIDLDNVQIIKREGGDLKDSKFIEGLIIDKEIVNPMMPKNVKNVKIALVDHALEIVKTDISSEIEINNPEDMDNYLKQENQIIEDLIKKLKEAGTNVVFCQKGIDEAAQHYLVKNNIMAIRRVKHSDMKKLSKATKAKIVTDIKNISANDLGTAEIASEKKIGTSKMVFIEGCEDPKAITILIRGGSEQVLEEGKRSIENGLKISKTILKNPYIVGGAGSTEIEVRKHLNSYAEKLKGKEQIAIKHFADALEIIPTILIENSGKDPLDLVTNLRSKTNYKEKKYIGYDTVKDEFINTIEKGIVEPVEVKKQIFNLATELAIIFIRIDNYLRIKS